MRYIHKRNPCDNLRLNFLIFESERFLTASVSFIPANTQKPKHSRLTIYAKTHATLELKLFKPCLNFYTSVPARRTMFICIVFKNVIGLVFDNIFRESWGHRHFNTVQLLQVSALLFYNARLHFVRLKQISKMLNRKKRETERMLFVMNKLY